ncbi:hypothetical protein AB0I49_09460 [Streptomyces sp. NPDC050617]|uniref:hypothetical protein n=1 Tax=Streptomyces sp. NPDC050617 TaxID=3154628 RepID=UPI0034214449
MQLILVISIAIAIGAVAYIVHLFIRDHKIETRGRDIVAVVEDVRHVATSDSGSMTVKYRLSWHEDGATRYAEGRETILAARFPRLQKGCQIDIKYLDDDHIAFVFDK